MSSDNDTTPGTAPQPPAEPAESTEPVEQPPAESVESAEPVEQPPAEPAESAEPAEQPPTEPLASAPVLGDVEEVPAGYGQALLDGPPRVRSKEQRKRLWQVGAAVLLTVVTGAATAVAVTLPERTDLPGLATPNDGRYAFPELTLPPLPVGASAPADARLRAHAADLRALLLPLPKGAVGTAPSGAPGASASASLSATATASPSASTSPSASASPSDSPSPSASASASASVSPLPVAGRWVPCDADAMLAKPDDMAVSRLVSDACRAAAAQGWTAKDGTRTELRLLQFGSQNEAVDFYGRASLGTGTKDVESAESEDGVKGKYPVAFGQLEVLNARQEAGGTPTGRIAWLQSGDVVAVIQLTNPKGVPLQAFRQVVALQSELLA